MTGHVFQNSQLLHWFCKPESSQDVKAFSVSLLAWSHKNLIRPQINRTVKSKSSVIFTRCVQNTYRSIIYKNFKRGSKAWLMLLKIETLQESLLPLSAEVVSSLSYMHVNCMLWKLVLAMIQRCEPGFSNHKTSFEQAKPAKFARDSKNITELFSLEK